MIIDNYKLYYGRYVKNEWELTPKEKMLLDLLSDNNIHSNEELIEKCDFLSEASLRKYITMLRRKYIKIRNTYNTGYQMITEIRRNNEQ